MDGESAAGAEDPGFPTRRLSCQAMESQKLWKMLMMACLFSASDNPPAAPSPLHATEARCARPSSSWRTTPRRFLNSTSLLPSNYFHPCFHKKTVDKRKKDVIIANVGGTLWVNRWDERL